MEGPVVRRLKHLPALALIVLIAACGRDGAPVRPGAEPETAPPKDGIRISGEARVSVVTSL